MLLCVGYAISVMSNGAEVPKKEVTPPTKSQSKTNIVKFRAAVWRPTLRKSQKYATNSDPFLPSLMADPATAGKATKAPRLYTTLRNPTQEPVE
jgi:hypothetical protein